MCDEIGNIPSENGLLIPSVDNCYFRRCRHPQVTLRCASICADHFRYAHFSVQNQNRVDYFRIALLGDRSLMDL